MRLKLDSDGDSLDNIFTAHSLELGRNTEQRIDIVLININIDDDVFQSLNRWLQQVNKAGPVIQRVQD